MSEILNDPARPVPESALRRAMPIIDWLARAAQANPGMGTFFSEIGDRIVKAGVPLARLSIHARTLHPEIRGITAVWRQDRGTTLTPRYYGDERDVTYTNSPVYWINGGADGFRRRLERAHVRLDFAILEELKADGLTDYVARRLSFSDGNHNAITWSTDRPGGFGDDDLAFLDSLLPYFALVFEMRLGHLVTDNLLKTYLGADAGRRVLRGQVRRGSGQAIEAAILFADIRGFTDLSETLPGPTVIRLLNEYFEAVIEPVEAYGGEVLKLIGDGVLAIMPVHAGGPRPACLAALAVAKAAFANLAEVNQKRARRNDLLIRMGITGHLGSVIYGNIGGTSRLDFTVIGPAVNLVSRLQTLSRELGRGILVSSSFAHYAGSSVLSLGYHMLRGISAPQEVFGLSHEDDLYNGGASPAGFESG